MTEAKIVRVDETFRLSPRGETQRITRVTYFVGDNGPFSKDYTPAEFIPERVKRDLAEEARKFEELGIG